MKECYFQVLCQQANQNIQKILFIQEMSENQKSKSTIKTQFDEWGRKKYTIEQRSQSPEQEAPVIEQNQHKSLLLGREEDLNIEKYVGRIEKNKKSKKREVFYCELCSEGFKCDLAYITHLNSPHHNRKLGMSMKVKAVSTESVVQKLKSLKKGATTPHQDKQWAKFQQKAFAKKQVKAQKKQQELKEHQEDQQNEDQVLNNDEDDVEAEMMALGLPTSFGSKKQKR